MDRNQNWLKRYARPVTRINLEHHTFEVRASKSVGPLTLNETGTMLMARDGSIVKVTQNGPWRYRYEVKNRCGGFAPSLGILSGTQGGVGTDGMLGCIITATSEKAGWAGIYSLRPGKIDVEAGEGNVLIDFQGDGSVEACIETQHGEIIVRDELVRRKPRFGEAWPYYQGSLGLAINRAGGSVSVLIGNCEDGKPHVVIVTVDGQLYRAEVNGNKMSVFVEERLLQILVDNVALFKEPLAPSC